MVQLDQFRYLLWWAKASFIRLRHYCCPTSYPTIYDTSHSASCLASSSSLLIQPPYAPAISCAHCHMPSYTVSTTIFLFALSLLALSKRFSINPTVLFYKSTDAGASLPSRSCFEYLFKWHDVSMNQASRIPQFETLLLRIDWLNPNYTRFHA